MRPELWDIENALFAEGLQVIAGVDEAGRGPFAGDVYAAAVILPRGTVIEGLDDSKKLCAKRREQLFKKITEIAISYCVATADVVEIEKLNILGATHLAMNRAIAGLNRVPDIALIDGNSAKGITYQSKCIVKGDSRAASIAAASILAKVSRDRYMCELALDYPGYGFEKHKGYGTLEHMEAIRELGAAPVHRSLFLRKILNG